MNWLDLFDDDAEAARARNREHARIIASEPCEDDCEVFAAIMTVVPEESATHLIHTDRQIDVMIQRAMLEGS